MRNIYIDGEKVVKFNWELGNGESSTNRTPVSYYTPGDYLVTLRATLESERDIVRSMTVTVVNEGFKTVDVLPAL